MLTIYKSSAGSGKTYTLVKEYLKLIIRNPYFFKNVLAVTFTNKATAEMKQRIIEQLVLVSDGNTDDYTNDLSSETGLPKKDIKANAQLALQLILHNYTNFSVQTIDSFFNQTVRALSKELQLPLQFDVELNQTAVREQIVQTLFSTLGEDEKLTSQLETYAFQKMADDKGWNVEQEIFEISGELFKEKYRELIGSNNSKVYDEDVFKKVRAHKSIFENTMWGFGKSFLEKFDSLNLNTDDFFRKGSGNISYFKKLSEKQVAFEPGKMIQGLFEETGVWSKNDAVQQLATKHLQPILIDAVNYNNTNSQLYYSCICVDRLSSVAPLIEKLEEQLRIYRKENDIVLISDIASIIKTFISKNNAEFIYEKTGSRFKSFLIDEFQDTSNFQWNNFLPLIENSLSEYNDNTGVGGYDNLVVGDVKQSVYRWRGGNMKLLYKKITDDLKIFKDQLFTKNLNTNYRSKRTVIEFNNQLFSAAPQVLANNLNEEINALVNAVYQKEQVWQKVAEKNNSDGFVQVKFIDVRNYDSENEDEKPKWKDLAMEEMLQTIFKLLELNYRLGDICLLIRSNREGILLAEFLFANGIKQVITTDSLSLTTAPQINLLINAFRLVDDTKNQIAKAAVTNDNVFLQTTKSITDFGDKKADILTQYIFQNIKWLQQLTIYELAEKLISHFELNKLPDAYLQRFLDLMLELNGKNIYTLRDFLIWWDDNSTSDMCSVVTPENNDAIRIMTVHKSKGLQFPVVIMPFADWDIKTKWFEILWIKSKESPFDKLDAFPVNAVSDLANSYFADDLSAENSEAAIDNLNMLYVAFTRAEEHLYIFSQLQKSMDEVKSTGKLLYHLIHANEKWKTQFEVAENILELGTQTKKAATEKEKSKSYELKHFIHNNWKEKISIRVSKDSKRLSENIAEKINFGNVVHQALSKINTTDDADTALAAVSINYSLTDLQEKDLKEKVTTMLHHEKTKLWWNGTYQIKNEANIALTDGSIHRPDRVMIKNNTAILVDYKTGAHDEKYKKQLNDYANALKQMGYTVSEKWLCYLNEMEFMAV